VSDNNEPTLRNALDAVNASRKWTLLGISAMFFSVALLLFMLFMMVIPSLQPPGNVQQGITVDTPSGAPGVAINRLVPLKVLWVSSAIQLFFVACATIAVMLHVSRMTRAVLRAIESTRR
jgi:hypothetical protein